MVARRQGPVLSRRGFETVFGQYRGLRPSECDSPPSCAVHAVFGYCIEFSAAAVEFLRLSLRRHTSRAQVRVQLPCGEAEPARRDAQLAEVSLALFTVGFRPVNRVERKVPSS